MLHLNKPWDAVIDGMKRGGILGMRSGFKQAIDIMDKVAYDRSRRRPTVLIVASICSIFIRVPIMTLKNISKKTALKL